MAITTYDELRSAMAGWLVRSDLTERIKDFISLNEAIMNRVLKTGEMELATTLTTIADNPLVALPTGYSGIRGLRIYQGYWRDVQILPLQPSLDSGVAGALPSVASVIGSNLSFRPIPNGAYPLALNYYGKFTVLSDTNTSNWILESHPDAYLYGSLLQSAPYLGTDDRLPLWKSAFEAAIEQINEEDVDKRFRSMQLRSDVGLTYPRRFNVYSGWGS